MHYDFKLTLQQFKKPEMVENVRKFEADSKLQRFLGANIDLNHVNGRPIGISQRNSESASFPALTRCDVFPARTVEVTSGRMVTIGKKGCEKITFNRYR